LAVESECCIGVLGLQGDYEMHALAISRVDKAVARIVRFPEDLEGVDGLIIPGGESTTFTLLLDRTGLRDAVSDFIRSGRPVWGTCAGAILLGKRLLGDDGSVKVNPLGAIDITVSRNAYGRQVDSFEAPISIALNGNRRRQFTGVFIRAPRFSEPGPEVRVLASLSDEPVMAEQGNVIISSFHPELTGDDAVHRYFVSSALSRKEV
jgi:5'-phosphate synthase pdxT subunit